jgi:benzoyl-CoA reductase/2-hydroxyglutaryl-CoA dehydratase subunit BcrC/BadD/HgdB
MRTVDPAGDGDALVRLRRRYDDRWRMAGQDALHAGIPVVGYIGADVPVELITAVGALPLRLAEDATMSSQAGTVYLGDGIDEAARNVLSALLVNQYPCDLLLVSHDCDASTRLFYAVRELRRLGVAPQLPEVHVVDVLHLAHHASESYTAFRLTEIARLLERWIGRPLASSALADAIRRHNDDRRLLRAVNDLRQSDRPRLSGTDVLAVVGAGTAMPVDAHRAELREILENAVDMPTASGARAFLTGSSHGTARVYHALEERGLLVAGEDHDWGEPLFLTDVPGTDIDALAEYYHYRRAPSSKSSPATRAAQTLAGIDRSSARLLVSYVRRADPAPSWDVVAQSQVARTRGVATFQLRHQPLGELVVPEPDELARHVVDLSPVASDHPNEVQTHA